MPSAAIVILAAALSSQAGAQPAAAPGSDGRTAEAYYEFMLARHLENQGDEAGALAAIKRAQTADPKSAEIRAEMAGMYARQDKAAEAVDAATQALALDPNSAEAHRILGLVFAAWADGSANPPAERTPQQLRRDALEHLTKILDTPAVATDLNLQVTAARLHMRSGQPEKAIPILETVVSQAPFAVEPYTLLADARVAVGRIDEAAEALAMAAEIDPRRYTSLAELYERLGRWAEAAEAYSSGLTASRNPSREMRLRLIVALLNVNEPAAAQRALDTSNEMLQSAPQDARVLAYVSRAQRQLGNLPASEEAARKILASDPTNLSGLFELTQVLFARNEPAKVIELLAAFEKDAASRGKGNDMEAALLFSQLVYAYSNTKQYARAAELAAEAITRYPRDERFIHLRADALANSGKVEEAAALLQSLIDRDPLNADALNSLGYMLAERGVRLTEALTLIERALKVEPDNPAYLDSLAWALFKQGRAEDAETPMRKAADAMPKESVIQDHFGDVLAQRGKSDEAIAAWERALAGDGLGIDRPAVEKKIKDARGRRK